MTDHNLEERRRKARIAVKGRADAMVFGPQTTKGVQILEIGKGGVAFRYVAEFEPLDGELELDILWDHLGVYILKLKMRIVSDYQIPNEFLLGIIPIRRCGAEFVNMTEEQRFQLDYLIENYSMDDGEPEHPYAVHKAIAFPKGEEQWNTI